MIQVQQTTNSQEAGAELLLDTVNPLLYRTNAFRVSGLSVEATPRDINKKLQMFKILEMRSDGAAQTTGPLPLEPAPALDDIREVIQSLSDPELICSFRQRQRLPRHALCLSLVMRRMHAEDGLRG